MSGALRDFKDVIWFAGLDQVAPEPFPAILTKLSALHANAQAEVENIKEMICADRMATEALAAAPQPELSSKTGGYSRVFSTTNPGMDLSEAFNAIEYLRDSTIDPYANLVRNNYAAGNDMRWAIQNYMLQNNLTPESIQLTPEETESLRVVDRFFEEDGCVYVQRRALYWDNKHVHKDRITKSASSKEFGPD